MNDYWYAEATGRITISCHEVRDVLHHRVALQPFDPTLAAETAVLDAAFRSARRSAIGWRLTQTRASTMPNRISAFFPSCGPDAG